MLGPCASVALFRPEKTASRAGAAMAVAADVLALVYEPEMRMNLEESRAQETSLREADMTRSVGNN